MYPFTMKAITAKKSQWVNKIKWIILHHTAWWDFKSNMKLLSSWDKQVSVHFVIWENEECGKIWDPKDILWHCGKSCWWTCTDCNKDFLWIEVVWFWKYDTGQLIRLTDLVEYLMWVYNIPKDMILRHCDICQVVPYSKNKILRDWKRSSRKVDLWLKFFPMWFEKRRDLLKPRTESRYVNI